MPHEAIDYLKSLPEFDAGIFKKITGIEVEGENKKTIENNPSLALHSNKKDPLQ